MRCTLLSLMLIAGVGLVAQASTFDLPPESYDAWETEYPYQRNIDWTFDIAPTGDPTPDGAVGAHYEGWDDPYLWDSDFVTLDEGIEWYDSISIPGLTTRTGLIGVDNRAGTEKVSGFAWFHIDNWSGGDVKHLWIDLVGTGFQGISLQAEGGSPVNPPDFVRFRSLAGGWWQFTIFWAIEPNPVSEDVGLYWYVSPGDYRFYDRVHIATECLPLIPEPSTFILFGMGLVGVLGRIMRASPRKRKRA